ncbi:MAG: MFS transporter, partial [Gemmatimonadaceae bacterium]
QLVGSYLSGMVVQMNTLPGTPVAHDWKAVWLVPAAGALAVLVMFALLFKPQPTEK